MYLCICVFVYLCICIFVTEQRCPGSKDAIASKNSTKYALELCTVSLA